jgi:hypothetical protein
MCSLDFCTWLFAEKADDAENRVWQHWQISDESLKPFGVENIELVQRYLRAGSRPNVLSVSLQRSEIASGKQNLHAFLSEAQRARAADV